VPTSPQFQDEVQTRAEKAWVLATVEPEAAARDAEAVVAATDDPETLATAEAALALGLRLSGRVDEAEAVARRGRSRRVSPLAKSRVIAALGEVLLARGVPAEVLALMDEGLRLAGAGPENRLERARLENITGRAHFERFEHALAEQAFRRASELFCEARDHLGVASALMNVGNVRSRVGDYPGALESYRDSLAELEERTGGGRRAILQYNLALVCEIVGDLEATREMCRDALEADLSHDVYGLETLLQMLLGKANAELGELEAGRQALDAALVLARKEAVPKREASVLSEIGQLELMEGDPDAALAAFQAGLAVIEGVDAPAEDVQCRHGLARVHLARGEALAALGIVEALLEGPDDRPDRHTRLEILDTRAKALAAADDLAAADEARRALARLQRLTHDEQAAARAEHLTLLHRMQRARTREERLSVRVDEQDARLAEASAERAELQEQLRVSQRMEAMGRLAAGVAHDFNNLLTVILGHTDELMRRSVDEEDRIDAQGVLRAAERATDLTRRLLAFSRRQALEPQAVPLDDVVRELFPVLERLAGQDVVCDLRLEGGEDRVHVDSTQLEQVLLNLVTNAADAMPRGGRIVLATSQRRVERPLSGALHPVEPGAYVRLSVSDTGVGIPKELHTRIFEPFFTTKDASRGTGLGLATVYGVAHQSGGGLVVQSEPGKGCTIEVYLPVATEGAAGPGTESSRPVVTEQPRALDVLLVEDDADLRKVVAQGLRRHGLQVIEAEDGEQALDLVESGKADVEVVVTDLAMPGLDGGELFARLRTSRPDLRGIFTSGHRHREPVAAGQGVAWLPKPFSIAALARLVRELP
jgi:signal transduction histidine kinase